MPGEIPRSIRTSPGNDAERVEVSAKRVSVVSASGSIVFERLKDGSIKIASGSGGEAIKLDNFKQLKNAVRKLQPKKLGRKR